MVKSKKKAQPVKFQPVKEVEPVDSVEESDDGEEVFYDSMIDDGTDDESDDKSGSENDVDESDDGFSEQEGPTPTPTSSKRKQNSTENPSMKKRRFDENRELFKQPTVEELNQLTETQNLFHSNLFRMQVQEILGELKVKEKYTKFVNSWMESFTNLVMKLKSDETKENIENLTWLKTKNVKVPLILDEKHHKSFQFQFLTPTENPFICGSFKNKTLIGPRLAVDVVVLMPSESFHKDDYLNLIYDRKRALYLTYLASTISEANKDNHQLAFNYFKNNPLKPVLEITPSGSIGKKLMLRIHVGASESAFKLNRFVPWNSNLRGTIFGEKDAQDSLPMATPNYNANVLFDLTIKKNLEALEVKLTAHKNLQEGLILLKVWLRQRNFDVGYSGFGNHIMTAFVVYLFMHRKLHTAMSSYQVARQVWNHLALSAWDEDGKGITLCSDATAANQPTLEQFSTYYDVVFVDFTGFCNICANLSVDMYRRVRAEAKRAIEILNNMKVNSFQLIFMTNCPVYTQYDHMLKISGEAVIEGVLRKYGLRADLHNFAGFWLPRILKMIADLLRKGLSERIFHLVPIETTTTSWKINAPPEQEPKNLRLGLILNPEEAYELLNKGPQANEDAAEDFRKFWGDKSQLRRFQDGSITETCVWATFGETFSQKRLIVKRIAEHLLRHHFQLKSTQIQYIAGELDISYRLNGNFKVDKLQTSIYPESDAESTAVEVIKSFDDLGMKLRSLDGLPLDITGIQGISSVFRYCDPVPIVPDARRSKLGILTRAVNHGVIQLGVSGKWPNELTALRAVKTAFYLQIAQMLREKHKFSAFVRYDGVFILKDGYVFHVEISHPKEIALMKKGVSEKGITHYKDTPESIALEKRLVLLPKVTSALHGLYQLHSSFGPTVMIAKRWLYSQLIDDGLWPDECTELLIASLFMKMGAQANTCQPQTAFFRFLYMLANTDWRTDMVLLNFNDQLDEESISKLESQFNTERDSFPPLLIVTSYDDNRYGIWTTDAPIVPVLARVTLLAKHTLSIIEPTVLNPSWKIIPSKLFTASQEGYDVLIRLKPQHVPNCMASEFPSAFSTWTQPNYRQLICGQDFLKSAITDLREAFTEFCIFFYNPCGGREIAVIWKPEIFTEREFKVAGLNGCSLSADGKRVKCNKAALIEDLKITLKDMYLSIEEMNK